MGERGTIRKKREGSLRGNESLSISDGSTREGPPRTKGASTKRDLDVVSKEKRGKEREREGPTKSPHRGKAE